MTSSIPSSAAMRSAVARLSPESMTGPHAELAERRDRLGRGFARGVGDRDHGGGAPVDGHLHRGATLARELRRALGEAVERDALALQQALVSDREAPPRDASRARRAPAPPRMQSGSRQLEAALLGGLDDRLGDRVLALALGGGDEPQHLVLGDAVGGRDGDHLGLAARERAGLVEHDGVERRGLLQGHRVLEQDAALRPQARARP